MPITSRVMSSWISMLTQTSHDWDVKKSFRLPTSSEPGTTAPPLMIAASKWKHQLRQAYSCAGSVGKTSCLKPLVISFRQSKAIEAWEVEGLMKWSFERSFSIRKSPSDAWLSRTGLLLSSGTLIIDWIPSKAWTMFSAPSWRRHASEVMESQREHGENNQHWGLPKELGHREGQGLRATSKNWLAFAGECLCRPWQNLLM